MRDLAYPGGYRALSVAVSFTRYGVWAAMLYTTLPLTIGLFASRYDWSGERRLAGSSNAAGSTGA